MQDELKRQLGPTFAVQEDPDEDPKTEKDPKKTGRDGELELDEEDDEEE